MADRPTGGLAFLPDRSRRGHARQNQPDFRALAGLAIEMEQPSEPVGDDVMDDMEAETNAAAVAAGGEEWIEGLTPHVEAHTAAVVGK